MALLATISSKILGGGSVYLDEVADIRLGRVEKNQAVLHWQEGASVPFPTVTLAVTTLEGMNVWQNLRRQRCQRTCSWIPPTMLASMLQTVFTYTPEQSAPSDLTLHVILVPEHQRDRQSYEVSREIAHKPGDWLEPFDGKGHVSRIPSGPSSDRAITAEIYGPDPQTRRVVAIKAPHNRFQF